MSEEYQALSTLVQGLNAVSLDLRLHDLIQDSLAAGSVSNAEMIAYAARKDDKMSEENYNALMFAFEKCDDAVI